jgi:hypothetical protein
MTNALTAAAIKTNKRPVQVPLLEVKRHSQVPLVRYPNYLLYYIQVMQATNKLHFTMVTAAQASSLRNGRLIPKLTWLLQFLSRIPDLILMKGVKLQEVATRYLKMTLKLWKWPHLFALKMVILSMVEPSKPKHLIPLWPPQAIHNKPRKQPINRISATMATSRSGRLRKASKRKMRRMGLKKRKRMT